MCVSEDPTHPTTITRLCMKPHLSIPLCYSAVKKRETNETTHLDSLFRWVLSGWNMEPSILGFILISCTPTSDSKTKDKCLIMSSFHFHACIPPLCCCCCCYLSFHSLSSSWITPCRLRGWLWLPPPFFFLPTPDLSLISAVSAFSPSPGENGYYLQ